MHLLGKSKCRLISSDSEASLSFAVSQLLALRLCSITSSKFSNKETSVVVNESVRGANVFVFQNQCKPANDSLMEILSVIQTCMLCSADRITAILPYMPYTSLHHAQQRSVNLQLIVKLLRKAGASQIITLEMDTFDAQCRLELPVENLTITDELCSWFRNNFSNLTEHCFVSLQKAENSSAQNLANSLGCGFAVFQTNFLDGESDLKNNSSDEIQLVRCIEGKTAVLVEGVSDDGYGLCMAAKSILEMGAKAIYAVVIHGTFTYDGLHRLSDSPITRIVTTNSVDQSENLQICPKLQCLDVSIHFASAIARIHNNSILEDPAGGCDDATPLSGDNVT